MENLFITCGSNLEDLLVKELASLGIGNLEAGFRGVYAPASLENIFIINYLSKIATRVLFPLLHFPCNNKEDLYIKAKPFAWDRWLPDGATFAIDANVTHPEFSNSLYAAQVLKDAICDNIREKYNTRPSINVANPDVQLNLFLSKKRASINFDTSLRPLFKRNIRQESVEAPLQESLAAALLRFANYSDNDTLCDPFCGSGTILIEALMQQKKIPSGYFREEFGFSTMPTFIPEKWEEFKKKHEPDMKAPLHNPIYGNDKDPTAIGASRTNLEKFSFDDKLILSYKDIAGYFPKTAPNLVITNPPYGIRLELEQRLYDNIAKFLQSRCTPDVRAFILSPSPANLQEALKKHSFKIVSTLKLSNGGIQTFLVHAEAQKSDA